MQTQATVRSGSADGGAGRRVVFLAGGPGLASSYASTILARTGFASDWSYFEQPGCGAADGAGPVDAQAVLDAAAEFVSARRAQWPLTLVAHSWGAWLALALLDRLPSESVEHTVLLHPAAPTRAGLDEGVAALFARVRPEAMAVIGPLMGRTDLEAGRQVMQALLPAYCGRDGDLPDLDLALHPPVYHGVTNTLGDYDQRPVLAAHRERLTLVFGEADTLTPELYARHAGGLDGFDVALVRGGHFGFLEDPAFGAVLRERGL